MTVPSKRAAVGQNLCRMKCRFHCNDKVDTDCRESIFSAHYGLTSGAKDAYLFGCLKARNPKVVVTGSQKHRDVSVEYTVNTGRENGTVRIC